MDIYVTLTIQTTLHLDQSLNDGTADKLRKYRADYNFNSTRGVDFIPAIASTSGRLHSTFIRILFLQAHWDTYRFLQLQEFCQCNQIVDSSTTSSRFFLLYSNLGLEIFSPRLQFSVLTSTLTDRQSCLSLKLTLQLYVLTSTLTDRQSCLSLTVTLYTHKLLVF
jgi:hypothetical protein